jgi:hypothetical protein
MQREAEEQRRFEETVMADDPALVGSGSTAAASTQEMNPDERKFVDVLINGTKSKDTGAVKFRGIMLGQNMLGQPNLPYTHQRNVVRNIASKKTKSYVVAHDPGLGKTATALMAYCAEGCMLDRRPKMIISVPSATMDQWQDAVADWVRVDPKKVLVTSRLKDVTYDALLKKDIIVLSRDCIARAYATCYMHYAKHHQIQTGPGLRWVSQWDRIGVFEGPGAMPPLHPLFEPPHNEAKGWYGQWDMMICDEVCFVTRTLTPHTRTSMATPLPMTLATRGGAASAHQYLAAWFGAPDSLARPAQRGSPGQSSHHVHTQQN